MAISKHLSFTTHIIACLLVSFLLFLSGCNQSDNAASSVPGSVQAVQEPANQTTQAPVKKSKTLTPQEELEKLALADEHIAAMVYVGKIVKIVCVPGRLVNIVARP